MHERQVGTVAHYFSHLQVAALELSEPLKVGERVHILGHSTDLQQTVDSMQVEHQSVQEGRPGQQVAIKVAGHVRQHDQVFKVLE